jgi:mycofactocin system glycosyltransferase
MSLGVKSWAGGRVLVGGSPCKVSSLAPSVQDLVLRLRAAGAAGIPLHTGRDRAAVRVLLDRGFAERAPGSRACESEAGVDIVVPVFNDPVRLRELLATLPTGRVVVVDDGSTDAAATEDVATAVGARAVRHAVNRGPGAARNTGLRYTTAPFVAFIDADCLADPSWPTGLLRHFDDPTVAAAAPRIKPAGNSSSLLERYETTRSSLDMGGQPELVRPGARLGFVPSAALVVRRSAIQPGGFDEDLRLGEDVDLIWRLAEAGWLVRYDPSVTVRHRTRSHLRSWLRRKMEYGTSAPALDRRHRGNLAPVRLSIWSLGTLALVAAGRPWAGAAVQGVPFLLLARRFSDVPNGTVLAARLTGLGLIADAVAVGRVLRREWWPLGVAVLATSPLSRLSRIGAVVMVTPLVLEWAQQGTRLDPLSYAALRFLDDGAYGTGVIASSIGKKSWSTLAPSTNRSRLGTSQVENGFLEQCRMRVNGLRRSH